MKAITLLLLFTFTSIGMYSQTNIDSLCNTIDKKNEDRRYAIKELFYDLKYIYDSTKTFKTRYGDNDGTYNGWYYISNSYNRTPKMIGKSYNRYATGNSKVDIFAIGCFDNGVPCCTWEYTIKWHKNETDEERRKQTVTKTESYTNGIIDGRQLYERDYNGKTVDTLYMTTFNMGTGYYKDFYPDGSLRMEGKLVNGYREGEWREYERENGKLMFIIVTEYDRANFKRDNEYYYPSSYMNEQIRKAVEWERQSTRLKKGEENPYYHE